jgi:hypothetical protein
MAIKTAEVFKGPQSFVIRFMTIVTLAIQQLYVVKAPYSTISVRFGPGHQFRGTTWATLILFCQQHHKGFTSYTPATLIHLA